VAIVEEAWREVGASFERFCLTAGIATLANMMEEDAARLCGPRYGRAEGKAGHRWGKTKGKVGFHGGKVEIEARVFAPVTAARSPWRAGRRRCPRTFSASGR
jgi:hypothetical protein